MSIEQITAVTALVIALGTGIGGVLTYRSTRKRDAAMVAVDRGKLELDERRDEAERENELRDRLDRLGDEIYTRLSTELDTERAARQRLAARVTQLTTAIEAAGLPIPAEPPWPPIAPPTTTGGTS